MCRSIWRTWRSSSAVRINAPGRVVQLKRTGPNVGGGQANAEIMGGTERCEALGGILFPLGDLQNQLPRKDRRGLKQAAEGFSEPRIEQVSGAQIDSARQLDSRR